MRLVDADALAMKLRHMGYMDENEEVQEVIDRFAEERDGDLISRQAAIAVADFSDYVGLSVDDVKKVTDEVVKGLKQLPSAENAGKWIPIAERKPEKHGRYLVSVYDHNRKYLEVGISYFYPEINDFDFLNAYENYYWEVTAWMERPEPYKENGKRIRKRKKNDG